MKLVRNNLYIIIPLMAMLWMACNRKKTQFVSHYYGISHARYEQLAYDTISEGFNWTEWDSTYKDNIIVEKNIAFNTLLFYLNETQHLASHNEYIFSFDLDEPQYIQYASDSSYDRFTLESKKLVWNHYLKEGNDSNYIIKKIDFTGEY